MKTLSSNIKKTELRERVLSYVKAHAIDNRIPTVSQIKRDLGVTNYMLLNCMNELTKEGVIYKKSRKEGTFLSTRSPKSVIGLVLEHGGENEYVNSPSLLSGFCSSFAHQKDFLLRLVQIPPDGDKVAVIRRLGLDALVQFSSFLDLSNAQFDKQIVHVLSGMVESNSAKLPKYNVVAVDDNYWIREYVKIGKLLGKKNFAIIGPNDNISKIMIDEITKQGLTWHPDCHISDLKIIPKKLPQIIQKYHIDAIRCSGTYLAQLAITVKQIPNFQPFFPFFGTEEVYSRLKEEYNYLNFSFVFEPLDDFYYRLGQESAQKVFDMVLSKKEFPTLKLKINHSNEYKNITENIGEQNDDK